MKNLLAAIVLGLVLAGACGCRCPGEVPVSLEPVCNFIDYHGPACWHYPHSCPPCPYYDYQDCAWRNSSPG